MKNILILVAFVSGCGKGTPAQDNNSSGGDSIPETVVWKAGDNPGVVNYFVYGLTVATDNTVLAFAEGRLANGDDAPHDIVLRRSKDGGVSWLSSQVLVKSKNGECYANPTALTDPETGKIILFYAQNHQNESSDLFFITSDDNGATWGAPQQITSLFAGDILQRPFHLPGPGHGIALKNGRLLVQVWHRYSVTMPSDQRKYGVSVIYSDDSGKTWKAGGYIPDPDGFPVNESRLVELSSGQVMMDGRPGKATASGNLGDRVESFSDDKGINWSTPVYGSKSKFTVVDAGLNKLSTGGKNYLLFTFPMGPNRNNLAISVSQDDGKTWPYTKMVHIGPATYSDVATLADGSIIILFGTEHGTAKMARCSLEWILK